MEDGNLAVLVDAKTEYTKQLVNTLKQNMYQGIKNIYHEARDHCVSIEKTQDTMKYFQELLSQIPKWNQELINIESRRIIEESGCDWLDDLITAVFVSHTRILTSINFTKNKKKINLKIPKIEHFIHVCYVEIARAFWKNPYMFDETIYKYDYQRNRRECENIVEQCITETIRKQLPVRDILKEYLTLEPDEPELPKEPIESSEKQTLQENFSNDDFQNNLRKMVKAELENVSNEKFNMAVNNVEPSQKDKILNTIDTNNPIKDLKSTSLDVSELKEEPLTESKIEPVENLLTESKIEPVENLLTEPNIESVENLVSEPKIETVENLVSEPKIESVENLVSEPKIESVEKLVSEPKIESVENLLTEPKIGPVENLLTEPKIERVENLLTEPKIERVENLLTEPKIERVENLVSELQSSHNNEENLRLQIEDKKEINIDKLIDNEINKDDGLDVESLDLDNMDDLSTLEEVYIDDNTSEGIDINSLSNNESAIESTTGFTKESNPVPVETKSLEPVNKDIKKIVIGGQNDKKELESNKEDNFKLNVLKKYVRKTDNYDFFEDANENDN